MRFGSFASEQAGRVQTNTHVTGDAPLFPARNSATPPITTSSLSNVGTISPQAPVNGTPLANADEWPYSLFNNPMTDCGTRTSTRVGLGSTRRHFSVGSSRDINKEIHDLQQSHASLVLQVSNLAFEVSRAQQRSQEAERVSRSPYCAEERALRRGIMFSNIASSRVLRKIHSELLQAYPVLIAANSVRQIVLKSRPVDCTLSDFRLLASYVLRRDDIHCSINPPIYNSILFSAMNITSITLRFETFSGIAEALQLSDDTRVTGLYKEKQCSGKLRGLQVLSVELVKYEDPLPDFCAAHATKQQDRPLAQRKVLFGRSALLSTDKDNGSVHVLLQESCKWTETSWDVGFQHREESRASLEKFDLPSTSKQSAFEMKWERSMDSPYARDSSPELVPGTLKCFFPAVLLRSGALTDGLQEIFKVQSDGSSLQRQLLSKP